MTWESGLRMYVEQSSLSEEEVEAHWEALAADDPEKAVIEVRGDKALFTHSESGYRVIFTENGLTIDMIADKNSVTEDGLISSIEDIVFEDS